MNENKNTTYDTVGCREGGAVGKFIAVDVYIKKKKQDLKSTP